MKSILHSSQRGQALIESLVATIALSTLLMGSLSTLYLGFSKLWLRHFSHEALICIASQNAPSLCQNQFIKNMHSVLPFGRLMVDEFFIYSDRLVIRSRWSFGMDTEPTRGSHFRLTEHQELRMPLQESFRSK